MITLAADNRQQERDRVVCPRALRRELIWDTHKQAHSRVSRVIRCLRLHWYWPRMTRDVRLRVASIAAPRKPLVDAGYTLVDQGR